MKMTGTKSALPTTAMPSVCSHDPVMAAWISQVTLRLRREVTWCWHQRAQCVDPGNGTLPPVADPTAENLNLIRYEHEKQHFFVTDVTARYLTEEIDRLRPTRSRHRGRWGFVVQTLKLDEAAQFILALALASRMDAGLAPVYCTCMNDLSRPYPTLALAQRLWYDPLAIIDCADVGHLLYRYGLLSGPGESQSRINWLDPIEMPTLVSHALLHNNESLPRGLSMLGSEKLRALSREGTALAHGLAAGSLDRSQIVPLVGLKGTEFAAWASTLAQRVGRPVIRVADEYPLNCGSLSALATVCWMRGLDILLPEHWGRRTKREGPHHTAAHLDSAPVRWYVPIYCENQIADLDSCAVTPPLKIAPLSFEERVNAFHRGLPDLSDSLFGAIEECARRFRFQDRTIARIARTLALDAMADEEHLIAACRNEAMIEMEGLAQVVTPRFGIDELVLPSSKMKQFQEILTSMKHLTRVHYHWGTARIWNEGGLSVLFSGPPGTGKTMGAEILSKELDLPMYRIDLSQVVNKYIGETEKNLKRIFDAAELCDSILFFDEADALFGKRTEVKDAHDRFANIEISYLLERMERFKGLAILATNRRKDVDEAFMRRLRYVIEFPLPDVMERERIWRQSFPPKLDVSDIDFSFLARQFQLAGGHIRSIAFNACLLSASAPQEACPDPGETIGRIPMKRCLLAVKRELDKMNRVSSEEVFGPFREMIRETVS